MDKTSGFSKINPNKMRGYCEDTGVFSAFAVLSGLCQLFCTDISASS